MILSRAVGIDLGTTNSSVAMLDPNERDLILYKDAHGRSTIPSCVWHNPRSGEVIVGHHAYVRKGTHPEPVSSIKRSMGTQIMLPFGKGESSSSDISAFIIRDLKKAMEDDLQERASPGVLYEVRRAIITVPAYFGLPAIEATREAGKKAGLEVMELLHEPTAAAIYYSWKQDLGDGVYMVYDLGGGTFDVSILRRTAGEFQVLGISGDNFLGGDDFDRRLAEHLRRMLVEDGYELELDVASNPEDQLRFNQLVALSERAKKELSSHEEFILRDQSTLRDKNGLPVVIETPLSRDLFEKLIEDLLDRTLGCCQEAIEKAHLKAGITLQDINHILLVGGSTYIPSVAEKVKKAFCRDRNDILKSMSSCPTPIRDDPETAVTLGAALRAATSGLGVGDDEKTIRLWFRGSGATKRERATINGTVELLETTLCLDGGYIQLSNEAGDLIGETILDSDLRFVFPRLELQEKALNQFRFEIFDTDGSSVTVLQRSIAHAVDQKDTVGGALSTAVLPKSIVMEGTDGDRLKRQVLLVEGTALPAKATFSFAVSDNTGHIRLPIYQENRIIKELTGEIGEIGVGTPVEVTISCDEQVHIAVQFSIRGQSYGGNLEPPPPETIPTEYEIEQIDVLFRTALRALDQSEADTLIHAYHKARNDLNEARSGGDYPKVIQRTADLRGFIKEARLAEPLHPSLETLENQMTSCFDLLPEAVKVKPDLVTSSLQGDLEDTLHKAKHAYSTRDRQTYEDAAHIINTILQFLLSVTRVSVTDDQEVDIVIRAIMVLEQTRQMTQFLLINCLLSDETEFFNELQEQLVEIEHLEKSVNTNPHNALQRSQVMTTEAKRIYTLLFPEEKTATGLEGLLRVTKRSEARSTDFSKDLFQ